MSDSADFEKLVRRIQADLRAGRAATERRRERSITVPIWAFAGIVSAAAFGLALLHYN